jgi:hypothetical protein
MTFSIAPIVGNTSSDFYGSTSSDYRVNAGIGNFGFIFSIPPQSKSGNQVKRINIGFGFNRQNDFNNRIDIYGVNRKNSMMTSYTDILNQRNTPPETVEFEFPFDIGLAYATNVIYWDSASDRYYCDAPYGGVSQNKSVTTYGSMNEMEFAVAANVSDHLFIGFNLGVPTISYYENSYYREAATSDTIPEFKSFEYYYNLKTRGTGVNAKLGVIFKPVNWVRIGASIHSPTWYPSMRDEYFSSMESHFTTTAWNSVRYSPFGYFDYRLLTPFRAFGSVAFIIGNYGIVSADYEYANYGQARFYSSTDNFNDINDQVADTYGSWGNIRFGTEWRLADFRIRGGFAYFSDPDKTININNEKIQISGGLGYRGKYFFTDVAYVWTRMAQDYYLYDPTLIDPASLTIHTHTVTTTVGVRF